MDSASQSDTSAGEPPSILANLFGFVIAIATLTLPLLVIDHFASVPTLPPPANLQPAELGP